MTIFVDANVLIRLFLNDDPDQHKRVLKFFERAQRGEVDLIVGPPVLFEMAWVLRRTYKQNRAAILDMLEALLSFRGLKMVDRDLVAESVELARSTDSDYADSYIAVSTERVKANCVASFNEKHFARLDCDLYPFDENNDR